MTRDIQVEYQQHNKLVICMYNHTKLLHYLQNSGNSQVLRFVFNDGSRVTTFRDGFLQRYKCNEVVNPIIYKLREQYGIMHKIDVENETVVPAKDGAIKLVPTRNFREMHQTYFDKALDLLVDSIPSGNTGLQVVRDILTNRFLLEESFVQGLSTEELIRTIGRSIIFESRSGYNGVLKKLQNDPSFSNTQVRIRPSFSTGPDSLTVSRTIRIDRPSSGLYNF